MKPRNDTVARRTFMGVVGGSCAILSGLALAKRFAPNAQAGGPPSQAAPKKEAVKGSMRQVETDVLVVGGGMAGVFAAVKAHDNGARVVLVDKGVVGKSGQTPFARGIFRYDEAKTGISKEEYLSQLAETSEYINNPDYSALLLDDSGARIDELDSWGFFDAAMYGDSLRRPIMERKIPLYERVTLTHLMKEDGRVAGALGMFLDKNETLVVRAKSVILCTGASGFKPAGWQIGSLTSDGDAMAYRIGAMITGKEWNDGHAMTNSGLEGLCSADSTPDIGMGMLGVETNIEVAKLGPSTTMGPPGPPPGADGEHGGPPDGKKGGPPGGGPPGGGPPGAGPPRGGPSAGKGPTMMGGTSAGMAIHKSEGLFPMDAKCSSNIPGLYAAGDSLGSMQSGGIYAQRGSSLAGSAVQGALAGKTAAEFAQAVELANVPESKLERLNDALYAPLLRERGFSPRWVTQTLQGIMIPNFILYVKSEERLKAALTYVEHLRDHEVPLLMANDLHELRQAHETANMILNAEMKLRASLMRTESRGSHYRRTTPNAMTVNGSPGSKFTEARTARCS